MKYERKFQLEDPDETICIEVKLRRKLPWLIICAYRAPDKPIASFIDYLDDVTREVLRSGKQIIIMGDFIPTNKSREFLDVYKLTQLIHEPTRSNFTSQSHIIDLLITSVPELFCYPVWAQRPFPNIWIPIFDQDQSKKPYNNFT